MDLIWKDKEAIIIYRRIEEVKDHIVLFRPVYNEHGNVTELFYLEDEKLKKACDKRSLIYVRQSLARIYNLDLSAQTREVENFLHRKNALPFYLPDGRVFVALKMRKPVIVGDNTYGFVDYHFIKSVRKVNGQVKLKLTTGDEITLYSTATVAYNSINLGRDVFEYTYGRTDHEKAKILDALETLLNKLYNIEKLLDKIQ